MVNFGLNSASILAQVNLGTNSASILGIFLAVAGAALYFLRSVRPELSRDQDIFFAAVGLLCGFILIFQGWRLDPILQFGQLLLVGSTVFFAVESIRLRAIATEQAKRKTPIVDEERRVSDRYEYAEVEAELDELEPVYEDRPVRGRIPGTRDTRSTTRDDYYEDEPRRRPERRSSEDRPTSGERPPRRRGTSRTVNRTAERYTEDEWGTTGQVDDWENPTTSEKRRPPRPSNGSSRPETRNEDVTPPRKRKKRRPSSDYSVTSRPTQDDEAIPTDYVEYKPINKSTDESDNSGDFDDDI